MSDEPNMDTESLLGGSHDRRSFLRKAAIGGAVAWTAPMVLSSPASAQGSGAPIEFVNASVGGGTTVDTIAVPAPAGLLAGDVLIAILATNPASANPINQTPAATFTQQNTQSATAFLATDNVRGYVLTRVATGSETSFSFTRTPFTAIVADAGPFRAAIVAYRNVSAVAAVTGSNNGNADQATHTFPTVTTAADNSMVVRLGAGGRGAATWATPGGSFTQRSNSGNSDRPIVVFDALQPTAGASGTTTLGFGTNRRATTFSVALSPLP